jgi:hypothetical protein
VLGLVDLLMTTTMTTPYPTPGDFAWMTNKWDADMLKDMWDAVTAANAWDFMKTDPGDGGFMFSRDPMIDRINAHVKTGHSGASFGVTMRVMQGIARNGWDWFVSTNGGPPKLTEKNAIGISALDCFQACGIMDPSAKCEHGIPFYACMPCSH